MSVPPSTSLPQKLQGTPYARYLDEGLPAITVYYVMPSGRVLALQAIEHPEKPDQYFTTRSPHYAYWLGIYVGQRTPGEALDDAIGHVSIELDRARKRVTKLEGKLQKYEASMARLLEGA